MSPTRASCLACLVAVATLLTGCSGAGEPETGVARDSTTAPASTTTTATETVTVPEGEGPAIPNTPDLSGNVIDCDAIDEPCDHGEDPQLDALWDACGTGDPRACDRLYYDAPFDTRYEQFGNTCGDRGVLVPCPDELE